jgi:hypothetical protein
MSSFSENFGIFGVYTRHLPWHDLRGATLPDSGERAYTLSKVYILMAARELARRLEGSSVDVLAGAATALSPNSVCAAKHPDTARQCPNCSVSTKGLLLWWKLI